MQVRHPIFDEPDYLDDAKETVRSICPIRSEMRTSCQWWVSCDSHLQLRHLYKTYLIMAVLWRTRTCLCHLFINKCLHNACQLFTNFTTREINTKITLSWALKQFVTRVHALLSMYCFEYMHYSLCIVYLGYGRMSFICTANRLYINVSPICYKMMHGCRQFAFAMENPVADQLTLKVT